MTDTEMHLHTLSLLQQYYDNNNYVSNNTDSPIPQF